MIELKVRRFGNSLGVILPKEVTRRLQATDGQALYLLEAPDGSYRLTPYDPAFEQKMTQAEDLMARYRNTLHVLAQ
ncbi:MAG: AbrB family transcriptional regulator [Candidatus Competibacteraceae bacterium]|nr:AbrB family transcriptional regulator [Candidatus Competibacteraceae bacterium]